MIDIKTRFAGSGDAATVENLRPLTDKFLDDVMFTQACLIYAPSQIALAALIHAASRQGLSLDTYVTNVLFADEEGQKNLTNIIEAVRSKLWGFFCKVTYKQNLLN